MRVSPGTPGIMLTQCLIALWRCHSRWPMHLVDRCGCASTGSRSVGGAWSPKSFTKPPNRLLHPGHTVHVRLPKAQGHLQLRVALHVLIHTAHAAPCYHGTGQAPPLRAAWLPSSSCCTPHHRYTPVLRRLDPLPSGTQELGAHPTWLTVECPDMAMALTPQVAGAALSPAAHGDPLTRVPCGGPTSMHSYVSPVMWIRVNGASEQSGGALFPLGGSVHSLLSSAGLDNAAKHGYILLNAFSLLLACYNYMPVWSNEHMQTCVVHS